MHVFELSEEIGVRGGKTHTDMGELPHCSQKGRSHPPGLNPEPACCEPTVLTTGNCASCNVNNSAVNHVYDISNKMIMKNDTKNVSLV